MDLEIPQGWQGALSLDSMKSSHPVMQEAEKPSEIDELFDAISYNKVSLIVDKRYSYNKSKLITFKYNPLLSNTIDYYRYQFTITKM